ncbi:MAG: phospholipase [Bacteroidaceae bacterium]|nr:phospholipase [Bacteroidaceae bacterium]
MIYLIVILSVLALGTAAAALHHQRSTDAPPTPPNPADMECCGQHEVCEKESLLAAVSRQVEYYDDEELDRFRGREGSDYSATETEEFRDVLYSMRSDEVAGWVRSLQLRQVALPDEIKDEVFMIVGERRQ